MRELRRSAAVDRWFRLREDAKQANASVQKIAHDLGKLAECAESSAKVVVRENMNSLAIVCQTNQGAES